VSLGWNDALFKSLAENNLLRISIHPPDIEHPAIWRQILTLTRQAVESRTAIPYGGIF
jgi:hypothetical protein